MSETLAFLKITFARGGAPLGESRVKDFFEQIEVSDFGFGVSSQPESRGRGSRDDDTSAATGIPARQGSTPGGPPRPGASGAGPASAAHGRGSAPQSRVALIAQQLQQRQQQGGAERRQRRQGSGNRSLAAAKMTDISFSKRFDASSAAFLSALNNEDTVNEAVFTVVQRDPRNAGQLQKVLVVTVRRAVIEAIDLKVSSGSGSAVEVTEEIRLRSDREGFGLRMEYISPATNASSAADYGRS